MRKCVFCDGVMEEKEVDVTRTWKGKKVTFHGISAFVCNVCEAKAFPAGEVKLMETIAESDSLPSGDAETLMNVRDVARYLRVSMQTVYNMLKSGRLVAVKVGREWRFPKEALIKGFRQESESGSFTHPLLSAVAFRKTGDLSEQDNDKLFGYALEAVAASRCDGVKR